MKKLFVFTAAMLLSLLAHSQEAEPTGSYAELEFIPHLEMLPNVTDKNTGFDLGNSTFFTKFEGSASEHFSWLLVNNWLTAVDTDDFGWQYRCLGYSNVTNWLLYCRADLTFGNWTISLGKDCLANGGFEYEDWDWDVHANFASPMWNSLTCYQWGGKVAWTTPSEMSNFSIQMASSPFGEHPFSSGLWTYSGQWRGEYGWFSNIWSVSAIEYEKGKFDWVYTLGQRVTLDKWSITLDVNNVVGLLDKDLEHFEKGTTLLGTVAYAPSDKFDCALKGIWSTAGWSAGAIAQFYPLRESQDLRLHAGVCYDNFLNCVSLNIGARYNIRLTLW